MGKANHQLVVEVVTRFSSGLMRYLRRRLGNAADARDIAQESYVRLLRMDKVEVIRDPQASVSNAFHGGPIAPQSLSAALDEFATRTKLQVVYRSNVATSVTTKGAAANLSPEETLEQLLQGTGLRYEFINERTIAIRPVVEERVQNAVSHSESLQKTSMRLAQAGEAEGSRSIAPSAESGAVDKAEPQNQRMMLEEVVVTGSKRIRWSACDLLSRCGQFKDSDDSDLPRGRQR